MPCHPDLRITNGLIKSVTGQERPKNSVDESAMGQMVLRLKNEMGQRSLVPRGPAVAKGHRLSPLLLKTFPPRSWL